MQILTFYVKYDTIYTNQALLEINIRSKKMSQRMAEILRQMSALLEMLAEEIENENAISNAEAEASSNQTKTDDGTETYDLYKKVSETLRKFGIPAHIRGYNCLRTAIVMIVEDPEMMNGVTKVLYPKIAEKYNTTSSRVERAIRHAIELAWDSGNDDIFKKFFGGKEKPTNSEFIAGLSDRLKLEIK